MCGPMCGGFKHTLRRKLELDTYFVLVIGLLSPEFSNSLKEHDRKNNAAGNVKPD